MSEMKRISGTKFTDEELREIASATRDWANYHGSSNESDLGHSDMEGMMVDVLFFTFKSINTLSYKKKFNKNGGYKLTEKSSDFKKVDVDNEGYEVVKKVIDVWYEGALVLGTDKIFNYKLCENMIRPEGFLNITSPNYIVYAPEIYQNRKYRF